MLADDQLFRNAAVDAALLLPHPLFFTHSNIIALINTARRENVTQRGYNLPLVLFHAQRHNLEGKTVVKFIYGQTRQTVRFAEYHAAGIAEAEASAIFPCRTNAAGKKISVDGFCSVVRQDSHGDSGISVKKPFCKEVQTAVQHLHNIAVFADVIRPVDFVIIDPQSAGFEIRFLTAPQTYLPNGHSSLLSLFCKKNDTFILT